MKNNLNAYTNTGMYFLSTGTTHSFLSKKGISNNEQVLEFMTLMIKITLKKLFKAAHH